MGPDELRRHALSLPETCEVETWGRLTFRVCGRIFALFSVDGLRASVKATPEEQAVLVGTQPDVFAVAPYVGRFGWVEVTVSAADAGQVCDLVTEAWRRTAPRRLVAAFDAARRAD